MFGFKEKRNGFKRLLRFPPPTFGGQATRNDSKWLFFYPRFSIVSTLFALCLGVLVSWCLCVNSVSADVTPAKFYEANLAYKNQEYYKAIDLYREVLSNGKESGPIYYNLGNAYFRVGDIGRSVLFYERAMRFIPRDTDLRANRGYVLSLVENPDIRKRVSLRQLIFDKHIVFFTQRELGYLVIGVFIFLILGHLWAVWRQWPLKKTVSFVIVVGGVLVFYGAGLFWRAGYDDVKAVMLNESSALFEPRQGSTEYYRVYAGNTVDFIREEGDYAKIRRSDGKSGWVKKNNVGRIMPGRDEFNSQQSEEL